VLFQLKISLVFLRFLVDSQLPLSTVDSQLGFLETREVVVCKVFCSRIDYIEECGAPPK